MGGYGHGGHVDAESAKERSSVEHERHPLRPGKSGSALRYSAPSDRRTAQVSSNAMGPLRWHATGALAARQCDGLSTNAATRSAQASGQGGDAVAHEPPSAPTSAESLSCASALTSLPTSAAAGGDALVEHAAAAA